MKRWRIVSFLSPLGWAPSERLESNERLLVSPTQTRTCLAPNETSNLVESTIVGQVGRETLGSGQRRAPIWPRRAHNDINTSEEICKHGSQHGPVSGPATCLSVQWQPRVLGAQLSPHKGSATVLCRPVSGAREL